MAGRIRTIKPEILSDAKAARLSDAAWRLWVSTWTLADDDGRLPADPAWLTAQVFWASGKDCIALLTELETAGLVRRYEVNADPFLEISGWKKHQKINRPSTWRYPDPHGLIDGSLSNHERLMRRPPTSDLRPSTFDHRPTTAAAPVGFDWDSLVALYPKPNGKSAGKRWLSRHIETQEQYDALKSAIGRYAERCKAEGVAEKFMPAFDRWLPDWESHAKASPPKSGATGKRNHREPAPHAAETKDRTHEL